MSTPNFVVEVTKQAAKHSLVFDCHFPEDEVGVDCTDSRSCISLSFFLLLFFFHLIAPQCFGFFQVSHAEGEEESDIFAVREVSFQPEGDTEWKETSYTLNTDSLDWVRFEFDFFFFKP